MKTSRQEKILELISENEISTQEELTARLNSLGYKATQATVSRDIKSLQLKKVSAGSRQKYAPSGNASGARERFLRIMADGLISIDRAGTLAVIRTIPGTAMAVAAALDELKLSQIVGSIAGDDTIMCACRSEQDAKTLTANINRLLKDIK